MNADGSGLARLTTSQGDDENPAWSPDGARIAFWSDRDDDSDIYVMNADGTGAAALTVNDDDDELPSWSPDGSRIAFTSDRDRQGDNEIFVMNADGSGVVQLTVTSASIDDWWPAWSPDGGHLAFVSDRGGDEDVFVVNADGRSPFNLTDNDDLEDFTPSWTPDGRVLFTSERAANLGIGTAAIDGSGQRAVGGRPRGGRATRAGRPTGDGSRSAPTGTAELEIFVSTPGARSARRLTRQHVESGLRGLRPSVVARRATARVHPLRRVRRGVPVHDERRRQRSPFPGGGRRHVLPRLVARRATGSPWR